MLVDRAVPGAMGPTMREAHLVLSIGALQGFLEGVTGYKVSNHSLPLLIRVICVICG